MQGALGAIGAVGALMNRVHQPRTLVVLGLNAGMGTAAEANELVVRLYPSSGEGVEFVPKEILGRSLCPAVGCMGLLDTEGISDPDRSSSEQRGRRLMSVLPSERVWRERRPLD